MSLVDLANGPATVVEETLAPLVPRLTPRDRVLPIFIVTSLVVHATIMLPYFLRSDTDELATRPKEIPIEVVQEAPKPPAAKPPPPPPKPRQVAKREAPKPPPKPPAPKPQAAKPQPKPESVSQRLKDLLGPMPAVALPGATADGTDEVSYSQLVLSKLAKAKKEGRYPGKPGAASVSFTLGDAGDIVRVAIVRPSGDPALDGEAIAMVKRGAPYPPPPPGGRRDYTITLRFQPLI